MLVILDPVRDPRTLTGGEPDMTTEALRLTIVLAMFAGVVVVGIATTIAVAIYTIRGSVKS